MAKERGVDPEAVVWSGGLERMENECAAHKALDLIGDIGVWIGYLPSLSIRARDTGHELHHLLGRALRDASFHT
jgi:UDP-3-O-acyl-N-acetylglucosamine deacetylase